MPMYAPFILGCRCDFTQPRTKCSEFDSTQRRENAGAQSLMGEISAQSPAREHITLTDKSLFLGK